jgi:exodeoxyribonuclease VII large subunit
MLASLGYLSVLRRGFALVRDDAGRTVRSAAAVTTRQRLDVEFADGHIRAEAVAKPVATPGADPLVPADQQRPQRPPRSARGGQGELF